MRLFKSRGRSRRCTIESFVDDVTRSRSGILVSPGSVIPGEDSRAKKSCAEAATSSARRKGRLRSHELQSAKVKLAFGRKGRSARLFVSLAAWNVDTKGTSQGKAMR